MKVNKLQILELYTFTKKHYVEYYDLQTELVDHLANDIEQIWQEEPQLSFEDAKTKAFKKFGIFGFMEPIEQKEKAMNKRYKNYLWNEFKKWFEIPKIVITIALFLVFYLAFSTPYARFFSVIFYIIIAAFGIYKSWQLNKVFKRRKLKSNKKWMLENMIFKQVGGTTFFFILQFYNVFTISDKFLANGYTTIALALAFTFLALITFISLELLPNKAEKLLKETYPEFSL